MKTGNTKTPVSVRQYRTKKTPSNRYSKISRISKQNTTSILDLDVQQSLTAFAMARAAKMNNALNILKAPSSTQELMDIIDNEKSDFLIIDTGGFDLDTQRIAMYAADLIITPVSDSPMELHGLSVFSKTISKLQEAKPNLKATVLLNKVHPFAGKGEDSYVRTMDQRKCKYV